MPTQTSSLHTHRSKQTLGGNPQGTDGYYRSYVEECNSAPNTPQLIEDTTEFPTKLISVRNATSAVKNELCINLPLMWYSTYEMDPSN